MGTQDKQYDDGAVSSSLGQITFTYNEKMRTGLRSSLPPWFNKFDSTNLIRAISSALQDERLGGRSLKNVKDSHA